MAKRKLPPLPAGVDATSAEAIPALLTAFVDALPQTFQASAASLAFRDMVEEEYPAAWKDYIDAHWARHFYERLTAEVSRQRHQARRVARTGRNKARLTRSVTDITHSVDNHGQFKKLMVMTRADLALVRRGYESSAAMSLIHASFYKRIERRLKTDTETVGDRWRPDELEKLKGEIYSATDDDGPEVP